jgi:hypothetical protein
LGKFIDLTGQTFGELIVVCKIEKPEDKKHNYNCWKCLCECGKEVFTSSTALKNGKILNCGHAIIPDLVGQRFGKLTVIKYFGKEKSVNLWWCKCDCKKEKYVREFSLLQGDTKSCGCLRSEILDLVGQKFGRLTVLEMCPREKGDSTKWVCKCDCGKTIEVEGSSLKRGNTQSCGCLSIDRNYELAEDLIGQRFGRLLVVELVRIRNKRNVSERHWKCLCDCGKYTTVADRSLKHGQTKSCGCLQIETIRLELGLASFNKLYKTYKYGAEKRNLIFELSREQFKEITQKNCYYCDKPPSSCVKNKYDNGDYIYNGIDRLNSSNGYTVDNVVPCCWRCNTAKMDVPVDEFISWIKTVYNNLIKKEEIV